MRLKVTHRNRMAMDAGANRAFWVWLLFGTWATAIWMPAPPWSWYTWPTFITIALVSLYIFRGIFAMIYGYFSIKQEEREGLR